MGVDFSDDKFTLDPVKSVRYSGASGLPVFQKKWSLWRLIFVFSGIEINRGYKDGS